MKNTRLASILSSSLVASALAIGSLASTQFASAQDARPVADVNIPFTFQTTTQTLPAGKYRLILESNDLMYLRGPGSAGGMVMIHAAMKTNAPSHSVAVFARYGDKYYLRQIWTAGDPEGLELPKGRAEKESRLQAKNTQAASSIELALNTIPKQ
jgi:hypothetical protein